MRVTATIFCLFFLKLNLAHADPDHDLALAIGLGDNVALVKALNEGADPNKNDQFRNPPIYLAALAQNIGAIRILVQNGAEVNQPNGAGQTALHVAAANGYDDVVDALVQLGADLQLGDNDGILPAEIAVRNHEDELARHIVQLPHRNIHMPRQRNGFSLGSFIGGAAIATVVFVFAWSSSGDSGLEN